MLQSFLQSSSHSLGKVKIHIGGKWVERWKESKCVSHKISLWRFLSMWRVVNENHSNFDLFLRIIFLFTEFKFWHLIHVKFQ